DKVWVGANALSRDTAKFLVFYRSSGGSFGGGVTVVLGNGDETVIVQGQPAGAPLAIFAQGGNDVFDVAAAASSNYANLTLDGGDGSDTVNIFPSGSTLSQNVPFPRGGIGEWVVSFAGGLNSVIGYQNMEQEFSA